MGTSKIENARYNSVTTVLSDSELQRLRDWIEAQDPKPSRSEAARRLLLIGLDLLAGAKGGGKG
jgi:hypothetical protein